MLGITTLLDRWRTRQRLIFSYTAGGRKCFADPLQVDRKLEQHGGENWADLVKLVADLRKPLTPVSAAAMGEDAVAERRRKFGVAVSDLVRITRKVFELPNLDPATGSGVPDAEVIQVLGQYLDFANALAETASPLA